MLHNSKKIKDVLQWITSLQKIKTLWHRQTDFFNFGHTFTSVQIMSYMMNNVCFLQHQTQNEGTNDDISMYHEENPYEEGNLNPVYCMVSKG